MYNPKKITTQKITNSYTYQNPVAVAIIIMLATIITVQNVPPIYNTIKTNTINYLTSTTYHANNPNNNQANNNNQNTANINNCESSDLDCWGQTYIDLRTQQIMQENQKNNDHNFYIKSHEQALIEFTEYPLTVIGVKPLSTTN